MQRNFIVRRNNMDGLLVHLPKGFVEGVGCSVAVWHWKGEFVSVGSEFGRLAETWIVRDYEVVSLVRIEYIY